MQSILQIRRFRRQAHETTHVTLLPAPAAFSGKSDVEKADQSEESDSNTETSPSPKRDESEVFVEYDSPDDPMNPQNWPKRTKFLYTCLVTSIGFIVSWASSIDSGAVAPAAAEFHVSDVVESLATGVFLFAFGIGSLAAGPVSETVGRNPVYIATMSDCPTTLEVLKLIFS